MLWGSLLGHAHCRQGGIQRLCVQCDCIVYQAQAQSENRPAGCMSLVLMAAAWFLELVILGGQTLPSMRSSCAACWMPLVCERLWGRALLHLSLPLTAGVSVGMGVGVTRTHKVMPFSSSVRAVSRCCGQAPEKVLRP
ncbi:hypothetical protein DUNSADRAFT_8060 [Dunaliella salina]|uniref:Encoded protein n=1 Tax=Dunaliella salina TaxID=3046 RepID=A0ABQ7GK57_DUNSA|nr:hypothetical protein DUNSADRAFT_8060 [Dunaliella salina]|eukprot:KAF5835003.1 hypothetical protein DUNSADRAFT_8060 [Dunaliella salina]